MLKLIFAVHLCVAIGGCHLLRTPSNTALIVGQRLELMCQPVINYTVREWTSQASSNTNQSKIFTGYSIPRIVGSQRFGFTTANNSVNLYLNSTELNDAGKYDCHVQQVKKQLEHYSAQLIVLETEPICDDNLTTASSETLKEGDVVWMRCSVNYRGNIAPTMEWRQHGRNRYQVDSYVIAEMVTSNGNISSTLIIVINSTYNATYFTCRTYFQWDNTSSLNSTATNSPDYSYTWNSSVIIVSHTTIVQEERETVSESTSITKSTSDGLSHGFNAIYLVAGVAVLFGVASSLVALILCHRLRRKNAAAMTDLNPTEEPFQSEYDLIPYACTDGYETIEEVDEKNDIMFTKFPPRLGPLPTSNYSALAPVESNAPSLYSRMEHWKQSVDDGKSEVDGVKLLLNSHELTPKYLIPSDEKDIGREIILHPHDYLDLVTSAPEDVINDSEEMPSDYLKTFDSPLQSANSNAMEKVPEEHSSRIPTLGPNQYLVLSAEVAEGSADENMEISSTYLTTRGTNYLQ